MKLSRKSALAWVAAGCLSSAALQASAIGVTKVSGTVDFMQDGEYVVAVVRSNSTVHVEGTGTLDVLLVGGGGGGAVFYGGGGGGGQVLYRTGLDVEARDYEIVVGAGGAAGTKAANPGAENGFNGGDTTAFGLTAVGGGGGGCRMTGNAGASGGGAGAWGGANGYGAREGGFKAGDPGSITGAVSTIVGGFSGGACRNSGDTWVCYGGGGGGGGGAGQDAYYSGSGTAASSGKAGDGGVGVSCGITGSAKYYGGGGGGGANRGSSPAAGGQGGGGQGGRGYEDKYDGSYPGKGYPGEDFTGGGGGGGGGHQGSWCSAGRGGCGVVVLRYKAEFDPAALCDFEIVEGDVERGYVGEDEILIVRSDATVRVDASANVQVLAVGGGGGGGCYSGGGGGGGGVVYRAAYPVLAGQDIPIVVGLGGAGSADQAKNGSNGGDTVFVGLVAHGGGGGGSKASGSSGATGGGAGSWGNATPREGGYPTGAAGTLPGGVSQYPDEGYDGGSCTNKGEGYWRTYGGGGGGAGTPGGDGFVDPLSSEQKYGRAGQGGDGVVSAISGVRRYYGGGGGGGATRCYQYAVGGKGGGGHGALYETADVVYSADADCAPGAGENGTGGGGGGGGIVRATAGGRGGSGVVILRHRRKTAGCATVTVPRNEPTGGAYLRRRGYGIHTFAEDGVFTLARPATVDMLLVGGGGGGGSGRGGGGGAGQVSVLSNVLLSAGSYAVTIGAGGAGGSPGLQGADGGVTSVAFDRLVFSAVGGGGGGGGANNVSDYLLRTGRTGASGGGGGVPSEQGRSWIVYASSPGGEGLSGFGGGSAFCGNSHFRSWGGGGGGAGGRGLDASVVWSVTTNASTEVVTTNLVEDACCAGKGGDGIACDFSGDLVYYGGGGGGGNVGRGTLLLVPGGAGGGGTGGMGDPAKSATGEMIPPTAGEPGTGGGGGGGGGHSYSSYAGAAGGSGLVIIRYKYDPEGAVIIIR